jgi:RNA polymerase sigma factor (sigma-70 family)
MRLRWKTEDEWQDYYDSGLIGLINGVRSFDESKGYTLSTYLIPCIENAIKKQLVVKTSKKRQNEKGKDVSLNITINENEDSQLLDFIRDKRVSVEKEVERKVQLDTIILHLNKVGNIRDIAVMKLYYGLDGFPEMNYREIGKIFKVSSNAIEERVKKIIKKIKKEIEVENEKENN